jgi:hypothetical protein
MSHLAAAWLQVVAGETVGMKEMTWHMTLHSSENPMEKAMHTAERRMLALFFDNNCRSHDEPEGSIGRNVQRVDASSLKCKAGNLHSGVEQLTITQAERHQRKERERKGKERQRKRATTQAALGEALAQVETAGASLDTLNALDTAIVSAKRIREHGGASSSTDAPVVSFASGDLPEAVEASRGGVIEPEMRDACNGKGCCC